MAIYLHRPLLVTGKPGTGKSSLARAIASELKLGQVLHWPINTRSTLQEGLYYYDAIARLQDAQINQQEKDKLNIGDYICFLWANIRLLKDSGKRSPLEQI